MASKPPFVGEKVKVSEVFDLQMGKTPSRKNLSYWNNGDYDWVSIKDLGSYDRFVGRTKETISELGRVESGIKPVPANTLLMSFKLSIGKTAITTRETYTNEAIMAFLDRGYYDFDLGYMWHQFRSKDWMAGTNVAVMGKTLNKQTLGNAIINLPVMSDQLMVARQLDEVHALIDLTKNRLRMLDQLIKSRFVEVFGDPKTNSKSWDMQPLDHVCTTRLGKMLDSKKQTGLEGRPYLTNSDVQWFRFNLENLKTMDFDADDRIEFELKNGDVLVTEGGEVGRCAIWREEIDDCYFQKALHRIRCDQTVLLPEYFVWAFKMKSELGLFDPYTTSSTIAHLTGKKIKQVPLQLPPIELQQQFASFVEQVDKSRFIDSKNLHHG